VQSLTNVKKGIDLIIKFRNAIPEQFRSFVDPMIMGGLTKLGKAKGKDIEDYIANGMK
jgi:aminopeptidase N